MNITRRIPAVAAIGLTAVIALTGCTAAASGEPVNLATPNLTATATPVPTDGSQAYSTNTVVDESVAEELNDAKGETRAFKISDGSWVTTNVHEDLPQSVIDTVVASVGATEQHQAAGDGLTDLVTSQLGKFMCTVAHGIPDPAGIDWQGWAWSSGANYKGASFSTQDEAIAQCQAWAAEAGASDRLVLLTFQF